MILDNKFSGILEQGKGHLVVYEPAGEDLAFTRGLEIISNMTSVVDALTVRSKGLTTKSATQAVAAK